MSENIEGIKSKYITLFEARKYLIEARSEILELSQKPDFNFGRINKFLAENGYAKPDLIIVNHKNLDQIENEVQKYGISIKNVTGGQYEPLLNLIFLYDDVQSDGIIGKMDKLTQMATFIHECVHANQNTEGTKVSTNSKFFHVQRNGFAMASSTNENPVIVANKKLRGWFFEEGFVEYEAGRFAAENSDMSDLAKHGIDISTSGVGITFTSETGELKPYRVFSKYLNVEQDGIAYHIGESSLAAQAFENLIQKYPQLYRLARASRTDPKYLNKFIRELETIKKGLYFELNSLTATTTDFIAALDVIEKL
jgi:hypothetical protein